jgi:peptide/nickel transport system ATP-binding protein
MEVSAASELFHPPYHPYTEALLAAAPRLNRPKRVGSVLLEGEIPPPDQGQTGCPFYSRCPRCLGDICRTERPPWRVTGDGARIFCHIPLDELERVQQAASSDQQ